MPFKPSKPFKTTIEWVVILCIIVAISLWLNRHLLEKGTELAPLSLPDLQGNAQQIDWHDSRRTLIYAFAPWCGVCRISMPGLNLIQHDDVRVIVLAFDWQNTEEVSQFINDVGFQGQVLLADSALAQTLTVDAYPTYYVIDEMGKIQHRDRGVSTPPGLWLRTRL
ncbi:MAG: TlpA family protein disulfide reductase [Bacterioplanes sp.]|nr:TlpA family protein disulfide reductase [Bacterioplanes sp.]